MLYLVTSALTLLPLLQMPRISLADMKLVKTNRRLLNSRTTNGANLEALMLEGATMVQSVSKSKLWLLVDMQHLAGE